MRALAWVAAGAVTCAVVAGARSVGAPDPHAGPWRLAAERFRRNRTAMAALAFVATLYALMLLTPWLAPYDPVMQPNALALKELPPSLAHPFGTDGFGRDVLSRVLYGSRVSLTVALFAVLIAVLIGTAYGAVAGFYGGRVDAAMMRAVDAALSVPRLLLLIAVVALWQGVPLPALVVLLGTTGWFGVSRQVRAQVLALRGQEWAHAARALGAADLRVLVRHILPNALSPVIVAATLGIGNVIVLEAGLSYLGVGVQPPHPSWGNIIQEGYSNMTRVWWMSVFPGLAIVLTVMAFNVIGEALRDALDPREAGGGMPDA